MTTTVSGNLDDIPYCTSRSTAVPGLAAERQTNLPRASKPLVMMRKCRVLDSSDLPDMAGSSTVAPVFNHARLEHRLYLEADPGLLQARWL